MCNFRAEVRGLLEQFGDALCRRSPNFRLRAVSLFQDRPKRIRLRSRSLRRTAKVILALSDFFRKLLSLQILASNATFSSQRPLRRQNNGERLSRRFPSCQHKYGPLYYLNDEIWRQDLTRTTLCTPPAKLLQPGEQPLATRVLLNYKKRSQCQMGRTAHRVRWG
jgi:hypothetical protein